MWNWTAEFDRTGCVKIFCGGNAMILPKIPPYTRECFLVVQPCYWDYVSGTPGVNCNKVARGYAF